MLLAVLAACAQADPDAINSDGLFSDTAGLPAFTLTAPPPAEDPWSETLYWTGSGPLESLLGTGVFPQTPHWRVMMFTSTDGAVWSEGTTIAHSFGNLALLVHNDAVILTGVPQSNAELPLPADSIYAITSTDLVTWGSHGWRVISADGTQPTDASLHRDAEGNVRATYATMEGIRLAVRSGERFIAAASDDGVSYVRDDWFVWDGVQAPHCFVEDETLWLLAQAAGGTGIPKYRVMQECGEFGPMNTLMAPGSMPLDTCTTPVVDRLGEGLVLFCSAWWQ